MHESAFPTLTPAEHDVVQRVLVGMSTDEIARARGRSPSTVTNQLSSAFRKLGVRSRAELAARAFSGDIEVIAQRDDLTLRERQVAAMAARGHANKVIAHELGLQTSTVSAYLRDIARKLGVSSRVLLVRRLAADPP